MSAVPCRLCTVQKEELHRLSSCCTAAAAHGPSISLGRAAMICPRIMVTVGVKSPQKEHV
jgi:hypothetical protein